MVKTQFPKLFSSFRHCKNTTLPPHTQNQSIPTRKVVSIVMMPSSESFSFPLAHRLSLASVSRLSYGWNPARKYSSELRCIGRIFNTGLKGLHVLFNKSKNPKTFLGALQQNPGSQACYPGLQLLCIIPTRVPVTHDHISFAWTAWPLLLLPRGLDRIRAKGKKARELFHQREAGNEWTIYNCKNG